LGDNMIFTTTDARMGNIAQLFVYDVRANNRTWLMRTAEALAPVRLDQQGARAPP
jgi:hypothetical protein